jgi:preprotein translocase subunit SecE
VIPNHLVVGSNPTAPANSCPRADTVICSRCIIAKSSNLSRQNGIFLAYLLDSIFLSIKERLTMSIIKSEDSRKWITALTAIAAGLAGFIVFKFANQLGDWFDLETRISNYSLVAQGLGFVAGLGTFIYILKNSETSSYLKEVFNEILKVVWPSKDATIKSTIGIAIALVIISGVFTAVDFIFKKILELIY